MGAPPSKGTPRDGRLKANKPKAPAKRTPTAKPTKVARPKK